jgi:hypothetical protein
MKSTWTAQISSVFSALVAVVCPLCIPAFGAFLASVGLGFAVSVGFLQSLLVILLFLAILALAWSARIHKNWWVVIVGLIGGGLIYAGRYLWFSQILMVIGAVILVGISILNFRMKLRCGKCES